MTELRARVSALSLRKRVGILSALGVGLLVVVIAIASYVTVRATVLDQLDRTLISRAYAASNGALADPGILGRVPAEALGAADVKVALLSSDRQAVSAEGEASAPPMG
ncbi:MAG TPA: hypothetical protein VI076_04205 [Actinopolymorphaceae bacterium]